MYTGLDFTTSNISFGAVQTLFRNEEEEGRYVINILSFYIGIRCGNTANVP